MQSSVFVTRLQEFAMNLRIEALFQDFPRKKLVMKKNRKREFRKRDRNLYIQHDECN